MKKLATVNVGFIQNGHAQIEIERRTNDGWGIDSMVDDSRRDTWITFYRYEETINVVAVKVTALQFLMNDFNAPEFEDANDEMHRESWNVIANVMERYHQHRLSFRSRKELRDHMKEICKKFDNEKAQTTTKA